MRGGQIFAALMGLLVVGYIVYWYVDASSLRGKVEENLEVASRHFSEAGEGVKIGWEDVESHGFPFGVGIRIVAPYVERTVGERVQRIAIESLEVRPRGTEDRFTVEGVPLLKVTDTYKGQVFPYEVHLSSFPSVMFRTPEEEKRLPKQPRRDLGEARHTPMEELMAMPPDLVHQMSADLPTRFTMNIDYAGRKKVTVKHNIPNAAVTPWRSIDYRVGKDMEAFFNLLTRSVHYSR